jgi:thiol-disulfide isomerase/thioredoxin
MNSLLYLTVDDFGLQKSSQGGNILCHRVQGFVLVLFYSTKCQPCKELIPIFKSLPGRIMGCQFAMVNVNNRRLVEMMKNNISPIEAVPAIYLYINGKPYMKYEGSRTDHDLLSFVMDVINNLQAKRAFAPGRVKQEVGEAIPGYSIGVPLSGDKNKQVCYLKLEDYQNPNRNT